MDAAVKVYQLGEWLVEPARNRICRADEEIVLEPLAMNVLAHLLTVPNRVVSSEELLDKFWSNRSAEPGMVSRCIAQIRAALGDSATDPTYIETIRKRGYRLIAPVTVVDSSASQIDSSSSSQSQEEPFYPNKQLGGSTVQRTKFATLGLAVALIILSWIGWQYSQRQSIPPSPQAATNRPVIRAHIDIPSWIGRDTINPSNPAPSIAISDAGDLIAFIARDENGARSLRIRQLDRLASSRLEGTEGVLNPFFSSNGQWVGYFDNDVMKRISIDGGAQSTITNLSSDAWGASWGPDDKIVYAETGNGLKMISASGGTAEFVTRLDPSSSEYSHRLPQHIGGRNAVLFTVVAGKNEVWVLDLVTRERHYLFDGIAPKFIESGYLVYTTIEANRRASLWAVPFDSATLTTTGLPVPIQDGIDSYNAFAVSAVGPIVYLPNQGKLVGDLMLIEPAGKKTILDSGPIFAGPRFTHDGNTIAVSAESHGKPPELRTYDTQSGAWQKIADDARYPVWGKNDSTLTYWKMGSGLFDMPLDQHEPPTELVRSDQVLFAVDWIDNGSKLMHLQPQSGGGNIRVLTVTPGKQPRLLDKRLRGMTRLTSDQKWLASCRWPGGLFVASYPKIGGTVELAPAGCSPRWAQNDTRLYYIESNFLWTRSAKIGETIEFGPRQMITGFGSPTFSYSLYDVAESGLIVVARTHNTAPRPAILLTNWQDNLAAE